jgi:glucokinase
MNGNIVIGLDIGGTKTAIVAGDRRGNVLLRTQFMTEPRRGFATVFDELKARTRAMLEKHEGHVAALSISIGGPLDILRGVIKSPPNLPGWTDIPLKQLLVDEYGLPVFVEHDGNAGALAEWYFGAGRGFRNIVFITMGTGFGAGLILDGRLYRGTSDVAGEIGHIRIAEDGPNSYGKPGSLEGFGSGSGIARLAQMMYPAIWQEGTTIIDVHDAYKAGSPEALAVFDRAAMYLGRGLAMLGDALNPQRIILGGVGMRLAEALVEPAKRVFAAETLPEVRAACEIVPAQLGETIGDIASLCAAYDQGSLLDLQSAAE